MFNFSLVRGSYVLFKCKDSANRMQRACSMLRCSLFSLLISRAKIRSFGEI